MIKKGLINSAGNPPSGNLGGCKTEGIKYAGSKLKLLPYIFELVNELDGIETVLDGFSGTTRVSQAFAQMGYSTTSNDISTWSEVFATCYLLANKPAAYYQGLIDHLNNIEGIDGWFTEHYGGAVNELKKPFQNKNTRKLDAIRQEIDTLELAWEDKCVLLTSLIYALDKVDNTLGHYVAYLSDWSARSYKDLELKLPLRFSLTGQNQVIHDDIFNTVAQNKYDLVYFDPPYGSNNEKMPPSRVRYGAYYHLWTTIIKNDKPELFGKANRRIDSRDDVSGSVFEEFRKNSDGDFMAMEAVRKLIKETNTRYLMLSYSSGGRATKQQLMDILAESGELLKVQLIDYKKNVMSSMRSTSEWINSDGKHQEFLFLMEKAPKFPKGDFDNVVKVKTSNNDTIYKQIKPTNLFKPPSGVWGLNNLYGNILYSGSTAYFKSINFSRFTRVGAFFVCTFVQRSCRQVLYVLQPSNIARSGKKINGQWQVKFFAPNVPANERPKLDADGDAMVDSKGKPVLEQIPLAELPDGDWRKYPETTEWGIGWLPLGGYCKISGMVDESMDLAQMSAEPQPWEYRSRPVWHRLPIIIGGVLVNFILAMVIFSASLFTWGEDYLPVQNAKYGLHFSPTLQKCGLKNGDNILKIDGIAIERTSDIVEKILIEGKQNITVKRDSQIVEVKLPTNFAQQVLAAEERDLVTARQPYVIAEVSPKMGAEAAKMQVGDSIVGINGKNLFVFQDIVTEFNKLASSQVEISYVRKGALMKSKVNIDENGKLGVLPYPAAKFMTIKHTDYGFLASIPAGISKGWDTLTGYVKQLKLVFTKEGSKQLGGFGAIGKMFPKVWDWQVFWSMTAILSMILAFMNFLPIPALDGGYVLFLLYEMITGRKPNDKFLEYAQTAGFFLLMGLLLFANGNDIFKAIFK